jgi:hypothetical protein
VQSLSEVCLYNLFVASQRGQWNDRAADIEVDRYLDNTDDDLAEQYKSLRPEVIQTLIGFPCLFAYEEQVKRPARIGWLTAIKPRTNRVRIEYRINDSLPAITPAKLRKMFAELDIPPHTINSRQWAVKNIDLADLLLRHGILDEKTLRSFARDGKPVLASTRSDVQTEEQQLSVFRTPITGPEPDLVSVMMPFARSFDAVFVTLKAACSACSLRCERADNIWDDEVVMQDVYSLIYRSRAVICDFSGRNSNVFYEAGIAHALGKPVIPIARSKKDIPFDLAHFRFANYKTSKLRDLKKKIVSRLKVVTKL